MNKFLTLLLLVTFSTQISYASCSITGGACSINNGIENKPPQSSTVSERYDNNGQKELQNSFPITKELRKNLDSSQQPEYIYTCQFGMCIPGVRSTN